MYIHKYIYKYITLIYIYINMGNKYGKPNNLIKSKYKLSFIANNITKNIKNYDIKNANNIKYVYFTISDIKPISIIQKDIKCYISTFENNDKLNVISDEKNIYEDNFETILSNNIVKNRINNKIWNDIYVYSNNGNKLIIRFQNINSNTFTIIYIDD